MNGLIEQGGIESPSSEGWKTVSFNVQFSANYIPMITGQTQFYSDSTASESGAIQVRMASSYPTNQNFKYYAVPTWGKQIWQSKGY